MDRETPQASNTVTLFLCGDVMTGRGIDQILPYPSDPRLCEGYVKSAFGYLELAERVNGPIPRPADFAYIWGDALAELERVRPDLRLINLETSVTTSEDCLPKGINYRMHPRNVPCLTAAAVDCCVLANNHVLDWGRAGLAETLQALRQARIRTVGAGRDRREAEAPAIIDIAGKGRVVVFAFGSGTSGIPGDWAAAEARPGVNRLADLSSQTVQRIAEQVKSVKRPKDIVVVSLHWGSNWGYEVPDAQVAFAHGLVDQAAVDVVYGHSSHHAKALEVYRDKPILYGCGDFLNDYEGISGYEAYRDDLVLMYFLTIDAKSGTLRRLAMTPLQIKRFTLHRASAADARWIKDILTREGERFRVRVETAAGGRLALQWH